MARWGGSSVCAQADLQAELSPRAGLGVEQGLVCAGGFATRKVPHGLGDITPDVRACGGCVALAGARCVPGGVVRVGLARCSFGRLRSVSSRTFFSLGPHGPRLRPSKKT